jgi:hypothetical protein
MDMSQNNSVSKVSWYGPGGQGFIPSNGMDFPLYHYIKNFFGVHQVFYATGIWGSFPEDMITRAWTLTLTSV